MSTRDTGSMASADLRLSFLSAASSGEGEDYGEADPLDEESALYFERQHCLDLAAEIRGNHPHEEHVRERPIAFALSGGGTRAAAFHCGVFWALADAGLMKDVTHLSAISGGAYTACSYITHVHHFSSEATDCASLDNWYRRTVAKFILRMQHNLNNLVETAPDRLFRRPRESDPRETGSGCLPRIFDVPVMIFLIIVQVVASPLMLLIHTVWPIVFSTEVYQGGALRAAWCDPNKSPLKTKAMHIWFSKTLAIMSAFCAAAIGLHVFRFIGFCARKKPGTDCARYLFTRSLRQVLERAAILMFMHLALVVMILLMQTVEWGYASGSSENAQEAQLVRYLCANYLRSGIGCSDHLSTWWNGTGGIDEYSDDAWVAENAAMPPGAVAGLPFVNGGGALFVWGFDRPALGFSGFVLMSVAALLMRTQLFKWTLTLVCPLAFVGVLAKVARWKIFGPITGQSLSTSSALAWDGSTERTVVTACIVAALVTLPVYDSIQKVAHLYSRRCLRMAYFHDGKDVDFASIANDAYCPNLILIGCLHDYRPPWEDRNFCDFTISSLFLGCRRTSWFATPSNSRLSHMMTVAGAATDATFLLNADILIVRVLLSVLSLRFGDFLRLRPEGPTALNVAKQVRRLINRDSSTKIRELMKLVGHDMTFTSRWFQGFLDRLPAAALFFASNVLLLLGVFSSGRSCFVTNSVLKVSLASFVAILIAGFFAHTSQLRFLMRSPMIQQFLMVSMHRHKAVKPPPYLYISDGGLIEVMGILPLLRRRLTRIVVSDAAEDPTLTMRCLRDAIAFARRERLCSFYDARHPYRDLEFVMQDFAKGDQPFMHLGLLYEHSQDEGGETKGDLFYVRMRLLPGDSQPTRALLTEEELLSTPKPASASQRLGGGLRRDMGGACCECSECGGLLAGRRFPNFGVSNQFLGASHFANLCSLGAEHACPLVKALSQT